MRHGLSIASKAARSSRCDRSAWAHIGLLDVVRLGGGATAATIRHFGKLAGISCGGRAEGGHKPYMGGGSVCRAVCGGAATATT